MKVLGGALDDLAAVVLGGVVLEVLYFDIHFNNKQQIGGKPSVTRTSGRSE